jgi:uncharacterized paraquat-inducible protein A
MKHILICDIMTNTPYPQNSPWILPPDKAPKVGISIAILLAGFAILIFALFYDLYSILQGHGFPIFAFLLLIFIGSGIIIWGARRFAKAYASKKYARIVKDMSKRGLRVCPHCGRAIPQDSEVCPYCGKQVE